MSVPLPNLPTPLRNKQQDTEELVKNEELPEPQDRDFPGEPQGTPGGTPAVFTTPATLPVEGATTTESQSDSAAIHIGQINPAFDANQNKSSTPVQFVANGEARTTQEQRVVTREDGSRVIITSPDESTSPERELREKDLRFLTIFSIIAVILFFPSGIPAVIYAMKTKKEFYIGKQKNDMTKAKKLCKKAEKLIILSLIAGLLTFALIFAIVERSVWGHHSDYYTHQHALAHTVG